MVLDLPPLDAEGAWSAMFSHDDWKVLVDALQSATELGDLDWEGDPSALESKRTALGFEANFDANARVELFGRFRGFSYSLKIYREGAEGYEFEDSITVTNKANSGGIPFDILFRTVHAQVRESWKRRKEATRDRWFAWATRCLELLPGHEHDVWDWDWESEDRWVAELTYGQWDSLVSQAIACTESKMLDWTVDEELDPNTPNRSYSAHIDDDFSLLLVLGGPDEAIELSIGEPRDTVPHEEFGYLIENPGGELERLAELIGASSRRKFQEILKNEALQGFLKGLDQK